MDSVFTRRCAWTIRELQKLREQAEKEYGLADEVSVRITRAIDELTWAEIRGNKLNEQN